MKKAINLKIRNMDGEGHKEAQRRITFPDVLRQGACILCNHELYGFVDDPAPDPRGPLGCFTASFFIAEEYGQAGPDIAVCWSCSNDQGEEVYEQALAKAKKRWKQFPQAPRVGHGA